MKNLRVKAALVLMILSLALSGAFAGEPVKIEDKELGTSVLLYPPLDEAHKNLLFYANDRFGYSVYVPDIFTEAVVLPDNGDGIILESKDGAARFRVSGGFLMDDRDSELESSLASALEAIAGNPVYSNAGENYRELWWLEGNVLHKRKFLAGEDAWCDCEISYPASMDEGEENPLDSVTDRSLDTLAFPVG